MSRRSTIGVLCAAAALTLACAMDHRAIVKVTIPAGATVRVAAESLSSAGLVRSATLFRIYAALRRGNRAIQAGTYRLPGNASWETVLDALRGGKGLVAIVTIPEGFSLGQISRLLEARLDVPADSMEAATTDTALLRQLDIPSRTVEGYLFPDTYTFPGGATAREAVHTMARRFEQVWRPDWTARLDSIPMSRHDLLTLASLVETEAKLGEERAVIAAVYMNRLRAGMLLQADPTVQYALGGHEARVFDKQLTVDSRYNTYKYKGLPPGPIASPGRASIIAALYPANVPYKYFVAFPDGHHEFHVDLASHDRAAAEARRAWDSVRPPGRASGAPLRSSGDTTRSSARKAPKSGRDR